MVCPLREIVGGEDMIVGHAEPVLALSFWWENVVRRIEIYPTVEDTSRRVSRELVADDGVLRLTNRRKTTKTNDAC